MINFGLYLTYFLLGVAILAAVIFPIIYLVKHPATAKRSLIGVGIMVVILLLAYLISPATPQGNVSAGTAKMVGGGLVALYILFIGAIVVAIYSEVSRLFK